MRALIFEPSWIYYSGPAIILYYHSKQWFKQIPSIRIVWVKQGQYQMPYNTGYTEKKRK